MSKARPRHEDGTCGYEVTRKNKDGIYASVALKDSRGQCPGDPMCRFTRLARIQARVNQLPSMERARKKMHAGLHLEGERIRDEWLYELVCLIKNIEPVATVDGYDWPYSKRALGGNAEYIRWPKDDV